MSETMIVKISAEEYMRMKAIQLDHGEHDAVAMIKLLLDRIEAEGRKSIKTHFNQ